MMLMHYYLQIICRPKYPSFFERFQQGWLKQCQDKFVYVFNSWFPSDITEGEKVDASLQKNLGREILNGERIGGKCKICITIYDYLADTCVHAKNEDRLKSLFLTI